MRRIVECVPNFSEGRDPKVIDQIVSAIVSVPGVFLLDHEMDASHNRSVVSFAGEPEAVAQAAINAVGKAAELIDLRTHKGEHPRIGATDVVPFIPISGVGIAECVELAVRVGEEIAARYGIPVYLYEEAARIPERRDLAHIRKGEFEQLSREMGRIPERQPDIGEPKIHPSAGATVVGARPALIAYNVYLDTPRVEVAKNIAKALRHSSGGFRYVKALGFEIKERNQAQVSMNLTNYEGTPLYRALDLVRREAERYGVRATSSEIVGLIPQRALNQCAEYYLQLEKFDENQILEHRLQSTLPESSASNATGFAHALLGFINGVATSDATPGGGSVAALAGALAAALAKMVCGLTLGKKKYAPVEEQVRDISLRVDGLKDRLFRLIQEDSLAYEGVMAAYRIPKENPGRSEKIESSLQRATEAPLNTATLGVDVLKLLHELVPICNQNALSDVGVGALMAHSAIKGAAYNVYINLSSIKSEHFKRTAQNRVENLIKTSDELSNDIDRMVSLSFKSNL